MKGGFVWICYEIVDRKDVESGAALEQTGDGVTNTILGKKPGGGGKILWIVCCNGPLKYF
jgi:hypothetical protein